MRCDRLRFIKTQPINVWLVRVNFSRVNYSLCHTYLLLWSCFQYHSAHFLTFTQRLWLNSSKCINGNTFLFYNYRNGYVSKSSLNTEEDRGDRLYTFGHQQTRSVMGEGTYTGPRPTLTFDIDVRCGMGTLPQRLLNEGLKLHPDIDVNKGTFDCKHYRSQMVITCPEMAKWGIPIRYHYRLQ